MATRRTHNSAILVVEVEEEKNPPKQRYKHAPQKKHKSQ